MRYATKIAIPQRRADALSLFLLDGTRPGPAANGYIIATFENGFGFRLLPAASRQALCAYLYDAENDVVRDDFEVTRSQPATLVPGCYVFAHCDDEYVVEVAVGEAASPSKAKKPPRAPKRTPPAPVSAEARIKYVLTGGTRCPRCRAQAFDRDTPNDGDSTTNTKVRRGVRCQNCKLCWTDVFTLAAIEIEKGS